MIINRRDLLIPAAAAVLLPSQLAFGQAQSQTPVSLPRIDNPQILTDWARGAVAEDGKATTALQEVIDDGRFSGMALVAIGGRPVLVRAAGMANRERGVPNTPDTRFNIASAGKMFTTVAVAQLLEEGRLGLEDKLSEHLPEFRPDVASTITIEQLLTHTAGFGTYFGSARWQDRRAAIRTVTDYLELVAPEQLQFSPGTDWGYSNSGFIVLGALLERLRDQDYYSIVSDRVFKPAGMRRTGFPLPTENEDDLAIPYTDGCFARPPGVCTPQPLADARPTQGVRGGPAGGGCSTGEDLLAFVTALQDGRLLRRETLDLFKAERLKITRPGGPIDAQALGFGRLTIHGQASWGHNGGTPGAGAQVDIVENAPITFIVLSNADGGQRLASARLRQALTPPGWVPPPPSVAQPVAVGPANS